MSDIQDDVPPVLKDPSNGQITDAYRRQMEAIAGEVDEVLHARDPRVWAQEYNAQFALAELGDPTDDRPRSPRAMDTSANFTHRISQSRED